MGVVGEFGTVRPDREQPKTGSLKQQRAASESNITTQEQAQLEKLAKMKNLILKELATVAKENKLSQQEMRMLCEQVEGAPKRMATITEESSSAQQVARQEKIQTFKRPERSRTEQQTLNNRAMTRYGKGEDAKRSACDISNLFSQKRQLQAIRTQGGIAQLKDDVDGAIIEGVLPAKSIVTIARAWRETFPQQ